MKEKKKRGFTSSRLLFYGLSLLVFYLAMRYMGQLKDIRNLLSQMNPFWIGLIFCLQTATYIFYALVLGALLFDRNKSHTIRFVTLFKMAIVLLFVNQTLPSGGISGNGYLLHQLVKRKVNGILAFKALIMESVSYYIAFISVLSCAYLSFRFSKFHTVINSTVIPYITIIGIIFFLALGIIMLLLNNRRIMILVLRKLNHFRFLHRHLQELHLPAYRSRGRRRKRVSINPASVLIAAGYQLCIIACDIATVFCLLSAFHFYLPVVLLVLGVLMSMVVGALPSSPGSLIVYESAMTYFLMLLTVPMHVAMAVTLLYRFITFWLPIPIGVLFCRNLQKEVTA